MAIFVDEYFINGILQLAGLFLAIAAGILAISLFKVSSKTQRLWSWKVLIAALVVFAIHKVFSALYAFNVLRTPYLGQLLPFAILALTFWAVIFQFHIIKAKEAVKDKRWLYKR